MTDEERIIWLTAFANASNQVTEWISPSKTQAEHGITLANAAVENFRLAKSSEFTPPGVFK